MSSSNPLWIGYTKNAMQGMIDEVQLYNGVLAPRELANQLAAATNTPARPNSTATITKTATPFTKTPTITQTVMPTPTPTVSPTLPVGSFPWGTGADGNLVVSVGQTVNLNSYISNGRSCADGIAYSVSSLSSTTATLAQTPASGCLTVGDEVLLVQLDDPDGNFTNTGVYEALRIYSLVDDMVVFTAPKVGHYGSAAMSDLGIGVGSDDQKVMLMRVPNYADVTVGGTLTADAWDGSNYGVLAFRASGIVSGSGTITMDGKGYKGISNGNGKGPGGGKRGGGDTGYGGGGGFGSVGYTNSAASSGAGGITYGSAGLERLYMGSAGGSGGSWSICNGGPNTGVCTYYNGGSGGDGGGIIHFLGQNIAFSGILRSNGETGGCSEKCHGGLGSGGSIRVDGNQVTLGQIEANSASGNGRVAAYGQTLPVIGQSAPAAKIGLLGEEATATPSPTPIVLATPEIQDFGTGMDGDLIVPLGQTYNIHTGHTGTNSACSQGGDAVSYAVKSLTTGSAQLTVAPATGCLAVGDEILLISMSGNGTEYVNIGTFEFLRVGGISDDTVYFAAPKNKTYGKTADSDEGIGETTSDQHVQILRVPNYASVTVNGTLTGSAWDGSNKGVMAFRVSGSLTGSGVISMDGMGYRGLSTNGCGESFTSLDGLSCLTAGVSGGGRKGGTQSNRTPDGGGGGHKTAGTTGTSAGDGMGGKAYGSMELDKLYPGSAGGKAGCQDTTNNGLQCGNAGGGDGGGVIYLLARQISMTNGVISSDGLGGGNDTGSGAGGSIRLEGVDISVGTVRVEGGIHNKAGSDGYIAVVYQGTNTVNGADHEVDLIPDGTTTPGPTPTPTAVPTVNPASAVWHTRVYNYSSAHPNRVMGTSDMDTYTYDENGNQVERVIEETTQTLAYNAENRLSNVSDGNGASEAYLYDGDGVRVARVRSDEASYLFMGGLYEVTLALPAGTVTGSKSYYTVEGQMLAMSDGSTTQYLLTDHLGSLVGVVDDSGALVSEQRYLPFGEARTLVGAPQTDLSFTGQRALTGTGLLDYHARQYDPALRAFIQADSIIPNPYGVLDYNRYLYVHANPVRFTDPSGNRICEEIDINGNCQTPPKTVLILACGDRLGDNCLGNFDDYDGKQPLSQYEKENEYDEVIYFGADSYLGSDGQPNTQLYALEIYDYLMSFERGTQINIIGHSRGAAAVIWAIDLTYSNRQKLIGNKRVLLLDASLSTDTLRYDTQTSVNNIVDNIKKVHIYNSVKYKISDLLNLNKIDLPIGSRTQYLAFSHFDLATKLFDW